MYLLFDQVGQQPNAMDGERRLPADCADIQRHTLSIAELSQLTGASESTIRRLKDAGQIPFSQPGGPRCRMFFPPDALEHRRSDRDGSPDGQGEARNEGRHSESTCTDASSKRRSGPLPQWLQRKQKRENQICQNPEKTN
jgi:excisionase family DNA binding protein